MSASGSVFRVRCSGLPITLPPGFDVDGGIEWGAVADVDALIAAAVNDTPLPPSEAEGSVAVPVVAAARPPPGQCTSW